MMIVIMVCRESRPDKGSTGRGTGEPAGRSPWQWTAPRDVPAYHPGPGGECGDRGGPVEDCHGYTLPPQPYFAGARLVLNVWGYTRTSHAMSSSFGPVLAGGEAIVITENSGAMTGLEL